MSDALLKQDYEPSMMEVERRLAARLRRRRRLLGMTQMELAALCGVRFQQIQKYESGLNRISAVRLWRLARGLGVDVDYFFADKPGD